MALHQCSHYHFRQPRHFPLRPLRRCSNAKSGSPRMAARNSLRVVLDEVLAVPISSCWWPVNQLLIGTLLIDVLPYPSLHTMALADTRNSATQMSPAQDASASTVSVPANTRPGHLPQWRYC
jgi:hypothetical protein